MITGTSRVARLQHHILMWYLSLLIVQIQLRGDVIMFVLASEEVFRFRHIEHQT